MLVTLKNDTSTATIDSKGAELQHFVIRGFDHMWTGDKAYWSGRSPVLFPIVGSLYQGEILIDGKKYVMGNHGFARHTEFEVDQISDVKAVFSLKATDETLAMYPFLFELTLTYTLAQDTMTIDYSVNNLDEKPLYFQLGTHPAFICPIGDSVLTDWYLEFEQKESLSRLGLKDNLINMDSQVVVMKDTHILPLDKELFKEAAIVFDQVKSRSVTLKSKKVSQSVKVSFKNFSILALWQPYHAPFLCIEPWTGFGDLYGFKGDITEKAKITQLNVGEVFQAQLMIEAQ